MIAWQKSCFDGIFKLVNEFHWNLLLLITIAHNNRRRTAWFSLLLHLNAINAQLTGQPGLTHLGVQIWIERSVELSISILIWFDRESLLKLINSLISSSICSCSAGYDCYAVLTAKSVFIWICERLNDKIIMNYEWVAISSKQIAIYYLFFLIQMMCH